MAIEIIVETGAGVTDANSYVSVDDTRTYAENRGVTLPVDDDAIAAMLIKATDYLEALACKYQGQKTNCSQSLQWPRSGVVICCENFASDAIPKQLKSAQAALVIAQNDGLVLQPNITAGDFVTEETVGPITTKYANPVQTGITARFTGVDALLEPLFFSSCGQASLTLRTNRV